MQSKSGTKIEPEDNNTPITIKPWYDPATVPLPIKPKHALGHFIPATYQIPELRILERLKVFLGPIRNEKTGKLVRTGHLTYLIREGGFNLKTITRWRNGVCKPRMTDQVKVHKLMAELGY